MVEPGDPAPSISAQNQHGETVSPGFEEPTVVYFYPEDFTGGCTIEANEFQDLLSEFHRSGVTVYGVSMDDAETHASFAESEGLEFDLLADPQGELASAFGLDTEGGRTDRRTFTLAGKEIIDVYDPVAKDPSGHARTVLEDLRAQPAD